jgi:rubrerythrin
MKTLKNLTKAFIGESQARNRYTIYSKTAKKEGYEQIAEIFLLTAENEREHAKWLFKLIQELKENSNEEIDSVTVEAEAPMGIGDTACNIEAAIAGEHYENSEMYPGFADTADKEGLNEIAIRLRAIGRAEEHHEERYQKLLNEVKSGTVFRKDNKVKWVCRKCGYVYVGEKPPEKCPACDHPLEYYEILCETY